MLDDILSGAISMRQKTPLRGRGGYSSIPKEDQATATDIDKAEAEALDFERIFKFFASDIRSQIVGQSILDFGSGFGGRTIAYVEKCGASKASGTEPFQQCIDAGNTIAAKHSLSDRVNFRLCSQSNILFDDSSFDAVLTFDVLEHVEDPRISLREIFRVLKPGGRLFAVFPVYRGALSHHLDCLTMLPALHLLFSPERILRVINRQLDRRPDIKVSRHYRPAKHHATGRAILPMLNGMGLRDFRKATTGWITRSIELNGIADIAFGRNLIVAKMARPLMNLPPPISEPFIFNVAAMLERPI